MTEPPIDPTLSPPRAGLLDIEEGTHEKIVLQGSDRKFDPYPRGTFLPVASGMAVVVVSILLTYLVPALHWARPWTSDDPALFWNIIGRELLGDSVGTTAADEGIAQAEQIAQSLAQKAAPVELVDKQVVTSREQPERAGTPAYTPHPDDELEVPLPLELADPHALDRFFASLTRTDIGYEGAVTRVTHWGDSVVANDNITSTLREQMQRRFGDSGHGFHLLAKPNASYRHRGVRFSGGQGWSRCYIIMKCRSDGRYGLGGTTVWSSGGGESTFRTATKTAYGRKASRFELWYLAQPRGGKIRLSVDDEPPIVVDTRADAIEDRWHAIEVEDGAHTFEVRAIGDGVSRAYGVVLERDVPGVVWDGMAQLGAFTSRFLYFDPEHISEQIAHRDPALIVFTFGGNDLQISANQLPKFKASFSKVLERFRAQPQPPDCLIMTPVDHGQRVAGRIVSDPMVAKLAAVQREVARGQGCAFFDTFAAMGGDGSAAKWRRSNPALLSGDLAHLTDDGQRVVGQMVYLALMQSYRDYRKRVEGTGAP